MRRILLSAAWALALAGPALAQTTLPTAGQYYSPGTTIPTSAQGVEQVGIDSVTNLRCMVGESTTCQVPTSGGGGGGGGGTSSTYGAAFPTTGTASGFKSSAGSTMQPGNLDGSGNILVSSTITGGSVGLLSGSQIVGKVGIDQTTPGTTNGVQVLTGSTTAVTQAAAANLNATVVGTGTFAVQDSPTATATGGATPASILSANSTNATNVKNGAGTLYHISVQNTSTTALGYLIFFNTSTTPTCTATPYYGPVAIPYVGSTGNNGSGVIEDFAVGLNFSTGISYCITAAPAGTGSVAANAISGGLGYK